MEIRVLSRVMEIATWWTFKPDPRVDLLGVDALKVNREEILFVAFAGWDTAVAKLFG